MPKVKEKNDGPVMKTACVVGPTAGRAACRCGRAAAECGPCPRPGNVLPMTLCWPPARPGSCAVVHDEWRYTTISGRPACGGSRCRARRFRRSSRAARRRCRRTAIARAVRRWRAASRRRSSTVAYTNASGEECIWIDPFCRDPRIDRVLPACAQEAGRSHRGSETWRHAGNELASCAIEWDRP